MPTTRKELSLNSEEIAKPLGKSKWEKNVEAKKSINTRKKQFGVANAVLKK